MRARCYQRAKAGCHLFVRLTPNAAKDEVLGLEDGVDGPLLRAKVRAVPDKGRANKALCDLIAAWLGLSKSDVSLKSGSKSRLKTLLLQGQAEDMTSTIDTRLTEIEG
jgi:uncharacterized protein YggU (UPF0235/DUF167 family)